MIDSISWWRSLQRNANFRDWVRDTYSRRELVDLANEATDVSLIRPEDLFADRSTSQQQAGDLLLKKTSDRLLRRYGSDIWNACLGAGGYDPEKGPVGLECLARLPLQQQVHDQASFAEFLVRNALRQAALSILGKTE